jgi:hypothetical protein
VGVVLALVVCLSAKPAGRAQTPSFAAGVALGNVQAAEVWEASGLVASRQNPGVVWTHNDSGHSGSVYALATNGAWLARYDVPNVDWGDFEDIAFGPGPSPEFHYVYLGDIGDNYLARSTIRVFRFPEPAVYAYQSNSPLTAPVTGAQEIALQYPDGPANAEALVVDPWNGDLFIATKLTNSSRIYRATRAELDGPQPVPLTFVREITFRLVSGGDVSSDGRLIALRRGNRAALWVRQNGQSLGDALGGSSSTIPVIGDPDEPNGEALGFHPTGLGYYTLSEGAEQPLYFFRRTDAGVPSQPAVFVGSGEPWRYQDQGLDEGTAWREPGFDDSGWAVGPGPFGYGQGDERTVLYFGDEFFKVRTTYFRKPFNVAGPLGLTNLALRVCFTDGVAVYLNGVEVLRRNLAPAADFYTLALASNAEYQNTWRSFPLPPSCLRAGSNTVAVEVHRWQEDGPDLTFDLQLVEDRVDLPARFVGTPQLTNGVCRLHLAGPVGALVTVDVSDDLLEWGQAGQVVLTNGTGLFQETLLPANSRRFYRIRP